MHGEWGGDGDNSAKKCGEWGWMGNKVVGMGRGRDMRKRKGTGRGLAGMGMVSIAMLVCLRRAVDGTLE